MLSHRVRQLFEPYGSLSHLLVACGVGALLALATLWLPPLLVLGAVLAIPLLIAIASRPELGLLVIVLVTGGLIDFERLPLLSIGPISFHITDLILLYLVALVLVRVLILPGFKVVRTPLDVPLMWFMFAVLLSAALAIILYSLNLNFVFRRLRSLVYYLAFFCITNLIRDRRQLRVLVVGLFGIAVLASLAMLIQVAIPSIQLIKTKTVGLVTAGRTYGDITRTYVGADRLIYSMLLVAVCSLGFGGKWLPGKFRVAGTGILLIGLFLTFQRNLWLTMLAMVALLGMLLPWPGRIHFLRWTLAGVVAIALLMSLPGLDQYGIAALDRLGWGMLPETLRGDSSTQDRILEMKYALHSIGQHPFFGIGLGNLYRPLMEGDAYWYPADPSIGLRWYSHNVYLWVWIDTGLFGLVPFVLLYASALVRGFTHWRKISEPGQQAVVLGITFAILGQAISNLVSPNFFQDWCLITFAIMLGINELIFLWEIPQVRRNLPVDTSREASRAGALS